MWPAIAEWVGLITTEACCSLDDWVVSTTTELVMVGTGTPGKWAETIVDGWAGLLPGVDKLLAS